MSRGVIVFSRDVKTRDIIKMAGGAPDDSLVYVKHEKSVFVNKILKKSRGKMRIKFDLGDLQDKSDDLPNNVDKNFDFGKEFESNGSYLIQKAYCKQRSKRNVVFSDLKAPTVKKGTLLATIDLC